MPATLKTAADIAGMRIAGRLASEVLDFVTPYVVPGVTTGELDRLCHEFVTDHGAISAPLGYRGFPKAICTSLRSDFVTPYVVPGVTTGELDRLCHEFVTDHGAISAPLGYRGFPKAICTSL